MVDLSEEELNLVLAIPVSNRLLFIDIIVKIGYRNYTMAMFPDVCVHLSGVAHQVQLYIPPGTSRSCNLSFKINLYVILNTHTFKFIINNCIFECICELQQFFKIRVATLSS